MVGGMVSLISETDAPVSTSMHMSTALTLTEVRTCRKQGVHSWLGTIAWRFLGFREYKSLLRTVLRLSRLSAPPLLPLLDATRLSKWPTLPH